MNIIYLEKFSALQMRQLNCNIKKDAAKVLKVKKNSETTKIRILRPQWSKNKNSEQQIFSEFLADFFSAKEGWIASKTARTRLIGIFGLFRNIQSYNYLKFALELNLCITEVSVFKFPESQKSKNNFKFYFLKTLKFFLTGTRITTEGLKTIHWLLLKVFSGCLELRWKLNHPMS